MLSPRSQVHGTVDTETDIAKAIKKSADFGRILYGYANTDRRAITNLLGEQKSNRGSRRSSISSDTGRASAAGLAGLVFPKLQHVQASPGR